MAQKFRQGLEVYGLQLRQGGAAGFLGIFGHSNTADRTYTLPDFTGTVSLIERAETISGAKTFSAITTVSNATASTLPSNGAFVVGGGVGIGGALNVGTSITTVAGNIVASHSSTSVAIAAKAPSGSSAFFQLYNNTFLRNTLYLDGAGNNLYIQSYDGTGALIDAPIQIPNTAAAPIVFARPLSGQSYLTSDGATTASEKVLTLAFTNGVADQKADIRFGNLSWSGPIEVTLSSTYSSGNAIGVVTKLYTFGGNAGGTVLQNDSRYVEAMGAAPANWALSDITWDATNSTWRIQVVHRNSVGNTVRIRIRSINSVAASAAIYNATISAVYTTDTTVFAQPVVTLWNQAQVAAPSGSGTSYFNIQSGTTSSQAQLRMSSSAGLRWAMVKNATAESGTNAGSDFQLWSYADDGTTTIDAPMQITRVAGGQITFGGSTNRPLDHLGTVQRFGLTTGATDFGIRAAAGSNRDLTFYTGSGSARWAFRTGAAETGSNAGSNWAHVAYDDSGVEIDRPITINRAANGVMTFSRPINTTSSIVTGSYIQTNSGTIILDTAAGNTRSLQFRSGGVNRWVLFGATSTAEGGSNTGSNLVLSAYDDSGTIIDSPIAINRVAGGGVQFSRPLIINGSIGGQGAATRYIGTGGSTTSFYYNAATAGQHTWAIGEVAKANVNSSSFNILSGVSLTVGGTMLSGTPSNNPARGSWVPMWGAIAAGKPLYLDEEFATGMNSLILYNNAGGSKVTLTREQLAAAVNISTASWAANVLSITTAAAHGLVVNDTFTVESVTPTAYNATYVVVTAPTTTTLTAALTTNPGTYTSGGTTRKPAIPNRTGWCVKILYDGTGTPETDPTPGIGGFALTINPVANRTFVQRFRALVPVGYTLNLTENPQGTNNTSYWATSNVGTGKYEEYIRVSHCGNVGTFAGGGHVYLSGANAVVPWYLASCNVYEADTGAVTDMLQNGFTTLGSITTTGLLTVNGDGVFNVVDDNGLSISRATGTLRSLRYATAGSTRWLAYTDAMAESGSNAGSNYAISAYTDGGSFIDTPLLINRAAGSLITMARPVSISAGSIQVGTNAGTTGIFKANTAAGNNHGYQILVAGNLRWFMYANSAAESGSDAGSNFTLNAYTDAGVSIDSPITITRAAGGNITLSRPLSIAASTGILINSGIPGVTTNKLYNNAGTLTWNGTAVGGGAGLGANTFTGVQTAIGFTNNTLNADRTAGFKSIVSGNTLLWGHPNTEYINSIGNWNNLGYPVISFYSYQSSGTINTLKRAGTQVPLWIECTNAGILNFKSAGGGTADTEITTGIVTALSLTAAGVLTIASDIQQNNNSYLKSRVVGGTATRILGINASDTLYLGALDTNLSGGMAFVNNGATQMQISSAGITTFSNNVNVTASDARIYVKGGAATNGFLFQQDTNKHGYLWNYENANIIVGTNNVTRLTIDNNGYATFTNRLYANDVLFINTPGKYIQMPASGGTNAWTMGVTGGTVTPGTASTSLGFHYYNGSAWSMPFTISASGTTRQWAAGAQDATGSYTWKNVAGFSVNTGTQTGTIKITLPVSWTDTMMRLKIKCFNYVNSGTHEFILGGYTYTGSSVWTNTSAVLLGTSPVTSVRFGHDGTKCCILLGATGTVWHYPKIIIEELTTTFYNADTGWDSGWAISQITSEAGITVSATPTFQASSFNPASYVEVAGDLMTGNLDFNNNIGIRGKDNGGTLRQILTVSPDADSFTQLWAANNAAGFRFVSQGAGATWATLTGTSFSHIGTIGATTFSGAGTDLTGTAASLTSGNANRLTGQTYASYSGNMFGGYTYESATNLNSCTTVLDSRFLQSNRTNGPSNDSGGMGYLFNMAGGDAANRGIQLLANAGGQFWWREMSNAGTWYQFMDTSTTQTIAGAKTFTSALAINAAASAAATLYLNGNGGSNGTRFSILSSSDSSVYLLNTANAALRIGTNNINDRLVIAASGEVSLSSTTDSSSNASGSFVTPGGAAIAKALYVGGKTVISKGIVAGVATATLTSGQAYTPAVDQANTFVLTLSSAGASSAINAPTGTLGIGQTINIVIIQAASAASVPTWNAAYKFFGVKNISTVGNGRSLVSCIWDGTYWQCTSVKDSA